MEIDCRGKACPQPVVMVKQALEGGIEGQLTVIVDSPTAHENVERFVTSRGYPVTVVKKEKDVYLYIQKDVSSNRTAVREENKSERVVVYINSHVLGTGDDALGSLLMRTFLKTLLDLERPNRLILINTGVRLASEGSDTLETLQALSDKGVEILSCGTCLDFYGLKERLRVGVVSNMYEIAQTLLQADRLVRP